MIVSVYVASDGRAYTPGEVVERLESGEWRSCLVDAGDGRELVETADGSLLLLVPYRRVDRKDAVRERLDPA